MANFLKRAKEMKIPLTASECGAVFGDIARIQNDTINQLCNLAERNRIPCNNIVEAFGILFSQFVEYKQSTNGEFREDRITLVTSRGEEND